MTLGLLQWGSDRLLHSKGEENEEAAKRVLMISGGAEGGEEEGSVTGDTQGTCENGTCGRGCDRLMLGPAQCPPPPAPPP